MRTTRELKESTALALDFLKFIISIGTEANFEIQMHKKYGFKMTPHRFSSTNSYLLMYHSFLDNIFEMGYRYKSDNDWKYQNGISINNRIIDSGYTLLCSRFIKYKNQRIELLDDFDDSDLLSLSTLYTVQEVQSIYILHELNKIPELYGIGISSNFIRFVNNMYIKIEINVQ